MCVVDQIFLAVAFNQRRIKYQFLIYHIAEDQIHTPQDNIHTNRGNLPREDNSIKRHNIHSSIPLPRENGN